VLADAIVDKNDPKDAQVLLHLLKTGVTQHYHDPLANQIHYFQELSLTYAQISLEKTRTQHRLLTHYLPLYFPEIERYYHASRSEWLFAFLQIFPTAALIDASRWKTSSNRRGRLSEVSSVNSGCLKTSTEQLSLDRDPG
jgi:hypothetical protein